MAQMKNTLTTKAPKEEQKKVRGGSEPKFPYTTKPSSLRRRYRKFRTGQSRRNSTKIFCDHGVSRTTMTTRCSVSLRVSGSLTIKMSPRSCTSTYMRLQGGAAALAEPVKRTYQPLFHASHKPYAGSNEELKNLFNIHSGGSGGTLELQMQTFKALCENTIFDAAAPATANGNGSTATPAALITPATASSTLGAAVNINVHIHLPENKTRRDYENIIEDIGRFIFGRTEGPRRNE